MFKCNEKISCFSLFLKTKQKQEKTTKKPQLIKQQMTNSGKIQTEKMPVPLCSVRFILNTKMPADHTNLLFFFKTTLKQTTKISEKEMQ